MEYMVFGKLLTYLRENRGRHNYYNFSHDSAVLTSPDLTLFACQVAAGMEYIAGKGVRVQHIGGLFICLFILSPTGEAPTDR